ncbi:hypothetical protein GALMADRAFT_1292696 [Galerina marginata CBS 339.88]|uniref:Uncharacterized protein n=1 Tax=Galerina marginata (strain CBS 339.88) TaxID=685588 RepID=A0A067T421_GALM3|nr:hypothetical protein GALMADRAFT_1292696 [Galerina marginata CBS 339.88]
MHIQALFPFFTAMLSIASVHGRECNDKHVIESKPFTTPSGVVITMERFNCSNTVPAQRLPTSAIEGRYPLEANNKRQSSLCTTSNCICGVPCFFNSCFPVNMPIKAGDCPALANSLINTPGTFTIPPGQALAFILNSCQYAAFGDSTTQPTQYCFNDFGAAAFQVFHVCGSTQQGSCIGTFNSGNFFVDQLNP